MRGRRSHGGASAVGVVATASAQFSAWRASQLATDLGATLEGLWVLDPALTDNTIVSNKFSIANDFSGNARHATQGAAGDRPADSGDINGHACALFSAGTVEWLALPGLGSLGDNRTFFALSKLTSTAPAVIYTVLTLQDGTDTDVTVWYKLKAGLGTDYNAQAMRTHATTSAACRRAELPALSTDVQMDILTHTGTDPTTGYTFRAAGADQTSAFADSIDCTPAYAATPGAIGATASVPERGFGGAIAFVGVMSSVATPAQVAAIEAYSLAVWGT